MILKRDHARDDCRWVNLALVERFVWDGHDGPKESRHGPRFELHFAERTEYVNGKRQIEAICSWLAAQSIMCAEPGSIVGE